MTPETILRHNDPFDSFQRSSVFAAWGSISLPAMVIANLGAAMAGHEPVAPRDPISVKPTSVAMARLQRIHATIGRLAISAPELFDHAEVAKSMEQALLGAVVSCLTAPETHQTSTARGRHLVLMRKFRAILEANPEEPVYLPELSAKLGVSGQTLRDWLQQHLGMGPRRYLMPRRIHLARRALMQGAPSTTTVTDAAMRYCFWELGRFAGRYKSVFCESPSTTLRRNEYLSQWI